MFQKCWLPGGGEADGTVCRSPCLLHGEETPMLVPSAAACARAALPAGWRGPCRPPRHGQSPVGVPMGHRPPLSSAHLAALPAATEHRPAPPQPVPSTAVQRAFEKVLPENQPEAASPTKVPAWSRPGPLPSPDPFVRLTQVSALWMYDDFHSWDLRFWEVLPALPRFLFFSPVFVLQMQIGV